VPSAILLLLRVLQKFVTDDAHNEPIESEDRSMRKAKIRERT
jgi:hypothetical protein